MKKLISTVVLGLISGAVFAQTVVNSANVVGYIQVVDPASNKYVLISAPLNSGTGTESTLLDIFGTNQLRQGIVATRCDNIIKWDKIQQKYSSFAQKTNGLFYSTLAFTGSPTNPVVERGEALWLLSPTAAYSPTSRVIYIAGDVPNDATYTNSLVGYSAYNFIANPYPVEMDINSLINTNDGAKGNAVATRADKIQLWDNTTQQYQNLALKISATVPAVNNKWLISTSFTVTNPPVITIKPGQGFWYQTTNNPITWVESKPYTLE